MVPPPTPRIVLDAEGRRCGRFPGEISPGKTPGQRGVEFGVAAAKLHQGAWLFTRVVAIPLTPVPPRCCGLGYGRLSADPWRDRGPLLIGVGLSRLSCPNPLARWVCLSFLRREDRMGDQTRTLDVPRVRTTDLSNGGHNLRAYAHSSAAVVSGNLVVCKPENGCLLSAPAERGAGRAGPV